jgi:hypothetical protein
MKKDILYALSCLFFTIMIGGAVYEHIVLVPKWAAAPPVSLSMFQGEYGLNPGPFWMIIHPTILFSFTVTLIMHRKTERRKPLATVFITYAIILIITSIYFVPELLSITSSAFSSTPDAQLIKRASLWEMLSLVRLGVLLVSAVVLFLGLAKSNATQLAASNKKRNANQVVPA